MLLDCVQLGFEKDLIYSPFDINPRTYKGGGVKGGCHPPKVFLIFFLDDKTSAHEVFVAVRLFLARILRQVK